MPLRTETVTVDGLEFRIQQLPGFRSFDLLTDIIGLLAPPMAKAFAEGGKGLADMDVSKLGDAVADLVERLPRQRRRAILEELFASVSHGGSLVWPQFDILFGGDRVFTVFKLAKETVRVNWGNFGGALAGEIRNRMARAAVGNPSSSGVSNTSDGLFGGSLSNESQA